MVEYIDRYVFYMSYQNCYVLFNIQKHCRPYLKQKNHVREV